MISNLSAREKGLIGLGGLALILFMGWTFVLKPGLSEMERLETSIAKHQQDLIEIRKTASELGRLRARVAGASGRISVRDKNFSLAGRVEERVESAGLKRSLQSLQPLPAQKTKDGLTQAAVDLKLKGFALENLVKLLHSLEYSDNPLEVARFTLIRGKKGLEASLRVEALIRN